ncbi:MAG: lytic transglycosylase [Deltaproteobacteria bacterium HGW-Deltaproteobacteria-9]|nr:MAG: lytic transglycosylase [Deltaproteobacteria bacterium HGW-Deltaproteobacteria-9]
MPRFVIKPFSILSFLLICLVAVQVFFMDRAFAQMPPEDVLPVSVPSTEKQQVAEINAAPAEPENKIQLTDQPAIEENNNKKAHEEEQNIMEDALALLDESEKHWKKGDLEGALDLLDQAYALIIETNDDPVVARQKDDLRLLISKRILAVYSSRQTVTVGKRSEVPLIMNADVEKEIRSFQSFERDFFISSYHRSGLYRPMMVRELKKAGLPEELSWLPLVESGFKISALSRARALGPWQFIPSTGYKYGLNRDEWIDERMDPEKSTRGAIGYLKDLHDMFGDWLTVLAAYNCGEGRVLRVISGQHLNYLDRFWDLYHILPYETARYVPRFLATLHIVKDPAKFGMDLGRPQEMKIPYEAVKSSKIMRLRDIAAALEIPEETLNALNPELRYRMTPDRDYPLKVPLETVEKFAKVADSIQASEKPRQVRMSTKSGYKRHKVKRGETAASIAHRYGISVNALMSYNGLSAKKEVRVGQRLKVPLRGTRYAKDTSGKAPPHDKGRSEQIGSYKVRKGDTLSSVAKRFNTVPSEIRRLNNIKGDALQAGRIIKVGGQGIVTDGETGPARQDGGRKAVKKTTIKTPEPGTPGAVYTVQSGDTLAKIARTNNVNLDKILELNKLDKTDNIRPGQLIVVK